MLLHKSYYFDRKCQQLKIIIKIAYITFNYVSRYFQHKKVYQVEIIYFKLELYQETNYIQYENNFFVTRAKNKKRNRRKENPKGCYGF